MDLHIQTRDLKDSAQIVDASLLKRSLQFSILDSPRKMIHTSNQKTQHQEHASGQSYFNPVKLKYKQLLPAHQLATYSQSQQFLMRIQAKIDEHLLYLKNFRGHKKGQFFQKIQKNLLQTSQLMIEMNHLRQIFFIDPKIYLYFWQTDKNNNKDILLSLPFDCQLPRRKNQFKENLFKFIKSREQIQNTNSLKIIPLFKFQFEQTFKKQKQEPKQPLKSSLHNTVQKQQQSQQKLSSSVKSIFSKGTSFKQMLYQRIKQKQQQIKQKLAKQDEPSFTKNDFLAIIDQIHISYLSKKVKNIFRATLIDILVKKLNIRQKTILQVLQKIINQHAQYLRPREHSKGIIIEMVNEKAYSKLRGQIMEGSILF